MFRKCVALTVAMTFMFSIVASAQSVADMTVLDKMAKIETIVYGTEQTGALVDRAAQVEQDVYGVASNEAVMAKADRLYDTMIVSGGEEASFMAKLNATEWAIKHEIETGSVKSRLEDMETVVNGAPSTGNYSARLERMMRLAYTTDEFATQSVTVPADTLIEIALISPINTANDREGDIIKFKVAEDVIVDNVLVFPKGAMGEGVITKLTPAKSFGRNAKLEIDFHSTTAFDGTTQETILGEKAKEQTKTLAMAAGASAVGLAVLGPVGLIGGIFVKGDDIEVPEGALLYIQTENESEVCGLVQ